MSCSRHHVLLTAIEFSAPVPDELVATGEHVISVFTSSCPIQNCLAPLILGKRVFTGCGEKLMNYLLDRCETTRFATKLCLPRGIDDDLATRLLQRMDFVMEITFKGLSSVTDALMLVILALSHLQRVRFVSVSMTVIRTINSHQSTKVITHHRPRNMTYQGTIKPLLHHPHESVRRSVASTLHASWLSPLSQGELIAAYRDDLLPLLDSASNNGSAHDALVAACAMLDWSFLPQEIVTEYFDRALRFLTAPSSHAALCNRALMIMNRCAKNLGVVETLTSHEVLPMLPRLIRDGKVALSSSGFARLLTGVFELELEGAALQQQIYDLQLLDLAYDTCMSPPRVLQTDAMGLTVFCDNDDDDDDKKSSRNTGGGNPLSSSELLKLFQAAIDDCPCTFLQESKIVPKLIQTVLVPWHRSVLAIALRLYHRSADRSAGCLAMIDANAQLFPPIPDDVHNAMQLLVYCLELRYNDKVVDKEFFADVSLLLFDEYEGFYCLPVLQTYIHLAVAHRAVSTATEAANECMKQFFSTLTLAREQEESLITGFDSNLTIRLWLHPPSEGSYPEDSHRVRRARRLCDENEWNDDPQLRWYLSELTMEDEVVFNALKRSPPALKRRGHHCEDPECLECGYDSYHDEGFDVKLGYDHVHKKYVNPDPYAAPKNDDDRCFYSDDEYDDDSVSDWMV